MRMSQNSLDKWSRRRRRRRRIRREETSTLGINVIEINIATSLMNHEYLILDPRVVAIILNNCKNIISSSCLEEVPNMGFLPQKNNLRLEERRHINIQNNQTHIGIYNI
ncbi:hypothetical protein ACJX0J_020938 [Zea mays]